MRKLLLALLLVASPAWAQQQQDIARQVVEQQRNQAMNAVADLAKANADLQQENAKLKAELEELKKKPAPTK